MRSKNTINVTDGWRRKSIYFWSCRTNYHCFCIVGAICPCCSCWLTSNNQCHFSWKKSFTSCLCNFYIKIISCIDCFIVWYYLHVGRIQSKSYWILNKSSTRIYNCSICIWGFISSYNTISSICKLRQYILCAQSINIWFTDVLRIW